MILARERDRSFAILVILMLLVVAACGDDDDGEDPGTTGTPTPSRSFVGLPPSEGATEAPTPTPRQTVYVVQAGDTLLAIADRFGVSVDSIVEVNGIDDPTLINVGQELIIPGGQAPVPTQPGSTPVVVEPTPDTPDEPDPPASVGLLTPVDKQHALPASYVPPDLAGIPGDYLAPGFGGSLRVEARDALVEMLGAAFSAGHDIKARSAYRSYAEQQATFQYWVDTLGYEEATRVSAMPGHSEHQLGTAADLTTAEVGWDLTESLGATAAGQWLAQHGHEYGFALSYPAGQEAVTGYAYEPWHFRYIGRDAAAGWKASGMTLNQYLLS
jgi:D-alanyl-D-alanine carboxypeptidase